MAAMDDDDLSDVSMSDEKDEPNDSTASSSSSSTSSSPSRRKQGRRPTKKSTKTSSATSSAASPASVKKEAPPKASSDDENGEEEDGDSKAEELPSTTFETKVRLSQSVLWDANCAFYELSGIEAFSVIPNYITSNCYIAKCYAQLIHGFVKDAYFNPQTKKLNLNEPVYIIELGTGTGKLSFHLLRKLHQDRQLMGFYENGVFQRIKFKFIMTDLAQKSIDHWRKSSYFKPFVDDGTLDFARFDAANDKELHLLHSGKVVTPASLENPAIVVVNYLFDSLKLDAYQTVDGSLQSVLLTTSSPYQPSDPKNFLKKYHIDFTNQEVRSATSTEPIKVYDDEELNLLLMQYQESLKEVGDSSFILPIDSITLIRNIQKLTNNRFLIISADKGYTHVNEFQGIEEVNIEYHGCISFLANYHAIGMYIRRHGGQYLRYRSRDTNFKVVSFALDKPVQNNTFESTYIDGPDDDRLEKYKGFLELRLAYKHWVREFGPDHFYLLYKSAKRAAFPSHILAILQLSDHDPDIFYKYRNTLMEELPASPYCKEIVEELHAMYSNFFHNGVAAEDDVAFAMGEVMHECGEFPAAIYYFQESARLDEWQQHVSIYRVGLAYQKMKMFDEAVKYYDQCLTLVPDYSHALDSKEKIKELRKKAENAAEEETEKAYTPFVPKLFNTLESEGEQS